MKGTGATLLRKRLLVVILLLAASCNPQPENVLRLATTTSTYDSGLLDEILPGFESKFGVRIDVVAVGTGQALALGRRGTRICFSYMSLSGKLSLYVMAMEPRDTR